jgi:hypothetical protein
MNDNAVFESYASSYVNDIRTIAQNDNLISINTAIMKWKALIPISLAQACSDTPS